MSIPGIIQGDTTWIKVVDPAHSTPPPQGMLRTLLTKRPPKWEPEGVQRCDIITPELKRWADILVESIGTIASSRTVADNYLGDAPRIQSQLLSYLHRRLQDIVAIDRSHIKLERALTTTPDQTILAEMCAAVDNSINLGVKEPVREIQKVASKVTLLDMQLDLPDRIDNLNDDRLLLIDEVTARIGAVFDLTT